MWEKIVTRYRRIDYVGITIFGFAVTAFWQRRHTIILPDKALAGIVGITGVPQVIALKVMSI